MRLHLAGDFDRALLGDLAGLGEGFVADGAFRHHALDHPVAVAELEEVQLAAGALVIEPTTQSDGLADVAGTELARGDREESHRIGG